MDDSIQIVKDNYDSGALREWERLEHHPFELEITRHMMDKYIKPGDKILDIGGGPGRYSIHYAKKGCVVTLFDLSSECVKFAQQKADEEGVRINAISGDARFVADLVDGEFDHVLLMGPLYHLVEKADRRIAVESAMKRLKKGGNLYASFIMIFAGMIYAMKNEPELLLRESEQIFIESALNDTSISGDAFTKAHFTTVSDMKSFMGEFPLEKLHIFGQEGITAPCERNILAQPAEVVQRWLEIACRTCEREDLLSLSEHAMYIGRKM